MVKYSINCNVSRLYSGNKKNSLAEINHFLISVMTTSSYKDFQGLTGRTVQIIPTIHNSSLTILEKVENASQRLTFSSNSHNYYIATDNSDGLWW